MTIKESGDGFALGSDLSSLFIMTIIQAARRKERNAIYSQSAAKKMLPTENTTIYLLFIDFSLSSKAYNLKIL